MLRFWRYTDKQPFKGYSAEESFRLNMQLSEDRAKTVADQLAQEGINHARIETHGYGPTQPEVDEDTQEAYAKNQRVTIEVR